MQIVFEVFFFVDRSCFEAQALRIWCFRVSHNTFHNCKIS